MLYALALLLSLMQTPKEKITLVNTAESDCIRVDRPSVVTVYCDYRSNGNGLDEVQKEDSSRGYKIRERVFIRDKPGIKASGRVEGILYMQYTLERDSSLAVGLQKEYDRLRPKAKENE